MMIYLLTSGDKENIAILYTPESFIFREPKLLFVLGLPKRRHATTAKYYKGFDKFQLGLFFFSQFWF